MTDEVIQTATPAEGENLELAQQPESNGSEQGTEQTPASGDTPETTEQQQKKTPWWQSRIDAITREKHEARAEAERYRHQLEAFNQQQTQHDPSQPLLPQAQIDAQVEQRLAQIRQQEAAQTQAAEFNKACNTAYEQGKAEFNDFDESLSTLGMVGLTQPVLDAAVRMDGGHRVLHYLGQNPDVAADLLALTPVQLGIRMAELKASVSKSARPVSNAPAPIKPLDGSSRGEPDPEKMTMDEWAAWRAKQAKR